MIIAITEQPYWKKYKILLYWKDIEKIKKIIEDKNGYFISSLSKGLSLLFSLKILLSIVIIK